MALSALREIKRQLALMQNRIANFEKALTEDTAWAEEMSQSSTFAEQITPQEDTDHQ